MQCTDLPREGNPPHTSHVHQVDSHRERQLVSMRNGIAQKEKYGLAVTDRDVIFILPFDEHILVK